MLNPAFAQNRQLSKPRVILKNFFDRQAEQPGSFECERQTGIELSFFDSIDGLPRDLKLGSELCLRPIMLCTEYLQPILHW
jgi:hypothetical protein